mmetsp:Transcript_21710/g.46768  ORF Transcript_21710/g.46768 Transcript_21710/m.46768 type:complete len:287 (-) Transcript_21710:348-1208(-)|eukprot:CAMPEP_0183346312 /NCGR_PEP_ID=MMETSP0164_2-20130417/11473_1 /TAXON_ID=221442 /ORGANISM="Coccolithus pelagicus ssp braarudi, Strain PLY182g" /LENGTH=286 /DNA_ID=CAMNT_0025517569 /DNA_START=59 /DNA_END=919 /DNA_ORIENTATION=-
MRSLLALLVITTPHHASTRGILALDNITFGRVVGHAAPALVRIDTEYNYGDEDDAFKELAEWVGESDAPLLVCTVGVGEPPYQYGRDSDDHDYGGYHDRRHEYEYGDDTEVEDPSANLANDHEFRDDTGPDEDGWRDNQDIAERFSVDLSALPQFLYFGPRSQAPKRYEGPRTKEGFGEFLQRVAQVWLGLPGQDPAMHDIAVQFVTASADGRVELLESAKAVATSASPAAGYYVKAMRKAVADDRFFEKEDARLRKMLDDGSLSAEKRTEFTRRLNALGSFAGAG